MFSLKRSGEGKPLLYLNDEQKDEAAVRAMFAKTKPADDQQVSLSADKGIVYGDVMNVINLLESVGLKKLSLDTRHIEPR
jgi:biopolymer transport protein ExbD